MSINRQLKRRILKPGKFADLIVQKTDGSGCIIYPKSPEFKSMHNQAMKQVRK